MVRALDLAWRGWGRVQPNPMVGAVVLSSDGRFVGAGWHAEFGERHAETIVLAGGGVGARRGAPRVRRAPRRADRAGGGGRAGTRRDAGGHARALHPSREAAAVL